MIVRIASPRAFMVARRPACQVPWCSRWGLALAVRGAAMTRGVRLEGLFGSPPSGARAGIHPGSADPPARRRRR